MALFGKSPVNGPSHYLNDKFQIWWYVLNSIGVFSFTLLVGSIGCGKYSYFVALISAFVVTWLLYIARNFFPELVKNFRAPNEPFENELAREITRDYLGVFLMPFTYLPYTVGVLGLYAYAVYPLIYNKYNLYVPVF